MIEIDFETRSRTSIKAGASRYSLDAEIMCLSYQIDGGGVRSWRPGDPDPGDLLDTIEMGDCVYAHNASFEMAIWQNVMVEQYGWPEIMPQQWRCTMAECLALALPPSLENAGEALGLTTTKDKTGHRLMLKLSKPRKPTKHDKSEWHEKPEDLQRLYDYCDQDVRAESAVYGAVRRLSKREQCVYHFDALVNRRGVMIDRQLAESAVAVWQQYTDKLNAELQDITYGWVQSADSVKVITELLPRIGCPMYSLNKDAVADRLKGSPAEPPLRPTARRILEVRQELAMSSVAKYTKMLLCVEPDDRIRGCFQFHGAGQTGRWAGRLVQLQNLPRGDFKKTDDIESLVELVKSQDLSRIEAESPLPLGKLLSSLVRSTIVAAPGKKLVVCDFASVEARALAWAADEDWLLTAFREGRDPYIEMAATIYNVPYDKVTKEQRFYGKQVILGAGYSLGASTFQLILQTHGVEASAAFCESVISAYRNKNKKIKSFWYATEKAAVQAVQTGQPKKVGPYTFHINGDWLHCRMPCGRDISYYKPELVPGQYGAQIRFMGVDPQTGKAKRDTTYSGKLVENLTQAVCRDLLVEAMSRLEKAGYTVIGHVHDEVIAEVDENFGSVEEMEEIMSIVPSWASGFPIGAEGFECKRYKKL